MFSHRNLYLQLPKEVFLHKTVSLDSRAGHASGELSNLSPESSFHWTLLVGETYETFGGEALFERKKNLDENYMGKNLLCHLQTSGITLEGPSYIHHGQLA